MRLEEIMELVVNSTPDDWHRIVCWGAHTGPSYRRQLAVTGSGNSWRPEFQDHSDLGIYKPNAAITLAIGWEYLDNFREEWANKFSDPQAKGCFADVFYSGALVFREPYVLVDGGRGILPIPDDRPQLRVSRRHVSFMKVVEHVRGGAAYGDYLKSAGMVVDDAAWPCW